MKHFLVKAVRQQDAHRPPQGKKVEQVCHVREELVPNLPAALCPDNQKPSVKTVRDKLRFMLSEL